VRLLLDEMIAATVAVQLRNRGHDVTAVQDPDLGHLRGLDDCVLLDHAAEQRRALVTDNIPDFLRCHPRRLDAGHSHFGLLLFSDETFPRHRHETFVSHILAALEQVLHARPHDDDSGWIRWLDEQS
jgi:hypothetical protein